eukprot:766177-Hanusia_phi.AAC.5
MSSSQVPALDLRQVRIVCPVAAPDTDEPALSRTEDGLLVQEGNRIPRSKGLCLISASVIVGSVLYQSTPGVIKVSVPGAPEVRGVLPRRVTKGIDRAGRRVYVHLRRVTDFVPHQEVRVDAPPVSGADLPLPLAVTGSSGSILAARFPAPCRQDQACRHTRLDPSRLPQSASDRHFFSASCPHCEPHCGFASPGSWYKPMLCPTRGHV